MKLDNRSSKLLEELMSNPSVTSKDIEQKFGLTRRQLGYSITKINEWLLTHKLPEIQRTRKGFFIIDESVFVTFSKGETLRQEDASVLSEQQRMYVILMMLLSKDDLSLIHFTSELKVSKNTILSDLKQSQQFIADYHVTIRYTRKDGYVLKGEEFQIRKLLLHVLDKFLRLKNGADLLSRLVDIKADDLREVTHRIESVEKKLNLKFTDERMATMPYSLILVIRRIKKGNLIRAFYIKYEELSDTKQYRATEEILYDFQDIPMEERLFITLYLLTTNVYWSEFLTEEAIPNLIEALDDMLRLFERRAVISIQDREQLLNKLLLHVKPAYYRIKYQLTEFSDGPQTVSQEFMELHHLVKKSTEPLAELIGMPIPENETTYLTMLIGGWLSKQGDSIKEKTKAIVVCPKGISVSRLMYSQLKELFPEFIFLDTLSVREFYHYPFAYDLVFSPIALETDKKLFISSSFMEREEKTRLRKQVMLEIQGYIASDLDAEEILTIVKKHAVISNEAELTKDLYRYLHRDDADAIRKQKGNEPAMTLADFITEETITLRDSASSWEAALKVGAAPLIRKGSIDRSYVDAMVGEVEKDPYIVIGPNLAIPHATPEDGVNEVSMSLLRLKKGVAFTEEYSIQLIFIIAALDKKKHLKALMQLMKLAGNTADQKALIEATDKEAILDIIRKYAND
ncbi:BglG family transcription antiterminator [Oceanobacillus kapialis]|uniref:Ascorbate-specific PTS system EIIA component n=1 Tax=Oceanobacillus kapialis TaxID=481353 RepID=A0ABW5PX83_9BACI